MEKGKTHRDIDEQNIICIIKDSSFFSKGSKILVRLFKVPSKLLGMDIQEAVKMDDFSKLFLLESAWGFISSFNTSFASTF